MSPPLFLIGKKAGHMTAGPVLVLIKDNLKTGERERIKASFFKTFHTFFIRLRGTGGLSSGSIHHRAEMDKGEKKEDDCVILHQG